MNETPRSKDDPFAVKGRIANMVASVKATQQSQQIIAATSDKRVRPKAVKAARYKRKGL